MAKHKKGVVKAIKIYSVNGSPLKKGDPVIETDVACFDSLVEKGLIEAEQKTKQKSDK